MTAIALQGVSKIYAAGSAREVVALCEVSLQIERGECVAIMGPSGSGKSTLMNLIGCLDTPSGGRYRCDGVDVATLNAESRAQLRLQKIGFVFQNFNLLARLSGLENVMLPLAYAGVATAECRERAHAALSAVGLADRASHAPNQLPGGQQQRVAIARALVNQPAIILADEPTGALDSASGGEVLALFSTLHARGHTVVLITHDPQVAAHANRCVQMRDGAIVESRLQA